MPTMQGQDSVTGSACSTDPTQVQWIGGYADGAYGPNDVYGSGWGAAAWARYPNQLHVPITVNGLPGARAGDCEDGTGLWPTPRLAQWAWHEVSQGRRPTCYGSWNDWNNGTGGYPSIDGALANVGLQRVRDVDGWVAWVNHGDQRIPNGFVARQYAQDVPGPNGNAIDLNVSDGIWPGAAPTPPPPVQTLFLADAGLEVPMDLGSALYIVRKWYIDYLGWDRQPETYQVELWWAQEILTKNLDAAFAEFTVTPEFQARAKERKSDLAWLLEQASKPPTP